MNKPLVSIIIATKNEENNINRLLNSVNFQTYPNIEVILVDNYSTDNTVNIAKKYTQKIFCHGPERSAQRNFGATKAHGKYLLFLDADMELPKKLIVDCVKLISKNSNISLIIPEDVTGDSFYQRIKRLEKRIYWYDANIEAARFFKADIFKQVNGYNEKLIAGEDWDLTARIKKLGKISRLSTSLYHQHSFWKEIKNKLYYAKHIKTYVQLHPDLFKHQSGFNRIKLFWNKRLLLLSDPVAGLGLLILKFFQLILYRISLIIL